MCHIRSISMSMMRMSGWGRRQRITKCFLNSRPHGCDAAACCHMHTQPSRALGKMHVYTRLCAASVVISCSDCQRTSSQPFHRPLRITTYVGLFCAVVPIVNAVTSLTARSRAPPQQNSKSTKRYSRPLRILFKITAARVFFPYFQREAKFDLKLP